MHSNEIDLNIYIKSKPICLERDNNYKKDINIYFCHRPWTIIRVGVEVSSGGKVFK